MPKCSFGCGKTAIVQFASSGKWCCSKSTSSCSAQKAKNALGKVGVNPWAGREHHRCRTGVPSWNAGLTKKTDKRVKDIAKATSKTLTGRAGHKHTEEAKRRISKRMKEVGAGGYREGSGRGRKGRYNGIWCDSSWELAFVLFCELHGREVKRARKRFKYVFEGKEHLYLPDFRYKGSSGTWKYLEVKGFKSEQWKAKKAAFPHELLFIGKRVISKQILPQVIKAYGKDFIRLYE